jgi:pyruvate dehydrogenase E1 component alpha subunit
MQVIRDDGSLDPNLDPGLSIDQVVALYKAMVRIRVIDDRLNRIQRQGRIAFHVSALGEEAAIVGSAAALRDQDWIVPCYREVGALLWRGYPLQRYIDHMYGNAGDPVRGRQMPDHTFSREHRYLSVSAPIGTQIPHAVGVAMAARKRGLDECVGVFFGDGATSSNDFHAAMNFAGVYRAPVLFLCRNNGYAISLPTERQTAVRTLAEKATAYRVPASRIDGNDVLAVWRTVREAVRRAAEGGGPSFIELMTYRLGGHSTSDDPRIYRDQEEVDAWSRADPLLRLRTHLEQRQVWSADLDSDWLSICEEEVKGCVRRAESTPPSELRDVFKDVYAEQPWHLREQEAECLAGPRAKDDEEDGS